VFFKMSRMIFIAILAEGKIPLKASQAQASHGGARKSRGSSFK